jgi:hypothetical protein
MIAKARAACGVPCMSSFISKSRCLVVCVYRKALKKKQDLFFYVKHAS